ncbi:MAG: dihydrolipoyl dehydrogenase [Parachlamydiaceae bacterium]|nr:dihydrolipoyl dehydrogenase [Parachlamydiaceae bacterium]
MSEEIYDVAVIGSGPGGYVAALRAAELGLKTVCIEKEASVGGTCLNVGCIPSKALLQSTEYYSFLKEDGAIHGIIAKDIFFDFEKTQQRKSEIVQGLVGGINMLFKSQKVTLKQGNAKFLTPSSVIVEGGGSSEEIKAKHFILATGSEPMPLPFLPFDEKRILSSTGALALSAPPKKMVVIGAGVIGVELGSVYNRLGTDVTFIEMLDRICVPMDATVSKMLLQILKKQGLKFHLGAKLLNGSAGDTEVTLTADIDGKETILNADVVLVAVGRRPYHLGLGLKEIGIATTSKGFVIVDGNFKTNVPTIFAIGDLIEGPMLAHKASTEGVAVAEIIAGQNPYINYMTIPNVIYTHPEVAAVGLSEEEAIERGLQIKVGTASFRSNPRARCVGYSEGMVKVIAEAQSLRIVGAHIIGPQASELIGEASLAIERHATLGDIASLSHAHPTLSETFHEAVLHAKG